MKKTVFRIFGLFMALVVFTSLIPSFAIGSSAVFDNGASAYDDGSDITKSDLSDLFNECSFYRSTCWDDLSWTTFKNALSEAAKVIASNVPSSYRIKKAYQKLSQAKESLVHLGEMTGCKYCLGESNEVGEENVISLSNVSYGENKRNVMDVYIPDNIVGNCSVVVYIHGGSWISGTNSALSVTAKEDCMKHGVVTAAILYRFIDENTVCSDLLDDVQASVKKLKEICSSYGLNAEKLMLSGISAGAHLSMLYAYSRKNVSAIEPVCVFDQAGPSDLSDPIYWDSYLGEENMGALFTWLTGVSITDAASQQENAGILKAISPLHYIDGDTVPTVICHGSRDTLIDYSQALLLADAFEKNGVDYQLLTFNSSHNLAKDPIMSAYSVTVFDSFVNKYLIGHDFGEEHSYTSTTVPKTCSQDGYSFNVCTDCGKYYISDVVKASHDPVTDEGYEATCTQPGLTDGCHCASCGEVIRQREVINALGHDFVNSVVAPTCTKKGYTSYDCSRCEESYAVDYVEATGHTSVVEVVVPATYTSDGTQVKKCTVCGEIIETNILPSLEPEFFLRDDAGLIVDNASSLIINIPQGTEYLGDFFNLAGCLVEVSGNIVATGSLITVKSFKNETIASFKAVVGGDVTGDGYVDSFDIAVAGEYINTFTEPDDAAFSKAIDLSGDKYLDSNDLGLLINIANFQE